MKKATKKTSTKLIVDEFDKFCQEAEESGQRKLKEYKKSNNYHRFIEEDLPEDSTKLCKRVIPQPVRKNRQQKYGSPHILYQNKYQRVSDDEEEQYDLTLEQIKREGAKQKNKVLSGKQFNKNMREEMFYENIPDRDYYPEEIEQMSRLNKVKETRPMSALFKKYQNQPKKQKNTREVQATLKKTLSTSKFKEQSRVVNVSNNKERGVHGSIHKNNVQLIQNKVPPRKQLYSQCRDVAPGNLKKKNIMTKPLKIEEIHKNSKNNLHNKKNNGQDLVQSVYFPKQDKMQIYPKTKFSVKKQEEKPEKMKVVNKRQEHKQQREKSQRSQVQKKQKTMFKPIIFQEEDQLRDRGYSRPRRQPVAQNEEIRRNREQQEVRQRRQQVRERRQQVREHRQNQHQREQAPLPRQQPASNRNQQRAQNAQRQGGVQRGQPRRQRRNNRNPSTDRVWSPNPNSIFRLVSQTLNGQFEFMNNQFNMMSNIFQNISNYVNINIDARPNYGFQQQSNLESSDDYDTDSSDSFSSNYGDYYEAEEEVEGMGEEELDMIGKIKYKVSEHGNNQCTICLIELKTGEQAKKLFCDHIFHSECIDEWLRRKSACPVCRDRQGVQ